MARFFKKTALKAFLRDCVGATGVLLLLVAGIADAQTGANTYVTCVTETLNTGAKVCSDETAGEMCDPNNSGKTCKPTSGLGCRCR